MKLGFLRTQDPGPRTQPHLRSLLPSSLRPLDSGVDLPDYIRQSKPDRGRKNLAACRAGGFTLIETALAMLAIGLGLIAIFGLGRLGLQSEIETLNDRRSVMMADAVFETLRERNAYYIELARTNLEGRTWGEYWARTVNMENDTLIPFPPVASITLPQQQNNLTFTGLPVDAFDPAYISIFNWNPRYALVLNARHSNQTYQQLKTLQADLHIFPDGDTLSSDARVFITTLHDSGGMP